MKEAMLYVNQQLIDYRHPKTNEKVHLFDEGGGQTTLGGFVVFKLNDKDKKEFHSSFGAFCVGTGDSPSFKYVHNTGKWIEMFKDDGQMLPFYGWAAHNIKDPTFTTAEIGDSFLACSDGVTDSFLDRNLPSVLNTEEDIPGYLAKKTFESHTNNKTDPDDVTIGSIKLVNHDSDTPFCYDKKGYPYQSIVKDYTTSFFPEFQITVDLLWESYSYPTKEV